VSVVVTEVQWMAGPIIAIDTVCTIFNNYFNI
jgi:hypothetical protein